LFLFLAIAYWIIDWVFFDGAGAGVGAAEYRELEYEVWGRAIMGVGEYEEDKSSFPYWASKSLLDLPESI
jgi:hypothetical protein